eukprot:298777_1
MSSLCKLCGESFDLLYQCHNNNCDTPLLFCVPCGQHAHRRKNHNFVDHMKPFQIKEDHVLDLNSNLEDDTKHDDHEQKLTMNCKSNTNISMAKVGVGLTTTLGALIIGAKAVPVVVGIGLTWTYLKTLQPLYSQFCPTDAQKRKELEMTAVEMFQFHEEDINNENIFNIKEINKRYHTFASLYHPDKKKNAEVYFIHMEIAKRILLSMKDPMLPFPKDAHQLSTQSSCDQSIKKQIQLK